MPHLLAWLRRPGASAASLSKAESELISLLKLSPNEPLGGSDLSLATAMVARGLLRSAGGRKYVLTEKAAVAYRTTQTRR